MSVKDFKTSLSVCEAKFAQADKRKHVLDNLLKARKVKCKYAFDQWRLCCEPGVPCTSRIMAYVESCTDGTSKEQIVACAEVRYCLRHI